jgi:hypothetical protein
MDAFALLLVIAMNFSALGVYFATLDPPPKAPKAPSPLAMPTIPPVLRSNVAVARLLRGEVIY